MNAIGKLFASELSSTHVAVGLNILSLRSHHKTPLDCWREVDAFKAVVAMEEKVSSRCSTHPIHAHPTLVEICQFTTTVDPASTYNIANITHDKSVKLPHNDPIDTKQYYIT